MLLLCAKTQSRRFKFFPFEERFWKAPFLWRVSVKGTSNHSLNKAAFSNSFGIVWSFAIRSGKLFRVKSNWNFFYQKLQSNNNSEVKKTDSSFNR